MKHGYCGINAVFITVLKLVVVKTWKPKRLLPVLYSRITIELVQLGGGGVGGKSGYGRVAVGVDFQTAW